MSSTTCPKMTFFCGACRPVSAACGGEARLRPSSVRRGRCPHRPAGGRWRPPLRCGTFPFSGPRRSPAAGVSFAAGGEAKDLELAATLSRCAPSATGNCSLLRRTCRWPAASLLFGLRSSLLPCPRALRASCHAAGWAHGRVAKRPFRETCRWASPSLFFRLHGLLAPLCAYPTRFLSRCGGCATPHCLPLREKHLAPAAQLLFRLRGALCGCSTGPRASCYISFAELIFTPGPMVEAHTQERMY